jgi:hypothetical protein
MFEHLDFLSKEDYPLEGYNALPSSTLVAAFQGRVAKVKGFVAYQSVTKQLIVSITGTQTLVQAIYDLRTVKHRRRFDGGQVKYQVHTGFWKMYKGLKSMAIESLRKGVQENDVEELVVGIICFL